MCYNHGQSQTVDKDNSLTVAGLRETLRISVKAIKLFLYRRGCPKSLTVHLPVFELINSLYYLN